MKPNCSVGWYVGQNWHAWLVSFKEHLFWQKQIHRSFTIMRTHLLLKLVFYNHCAAMCKEFEKYGNSFNGSYGKDLVQLDTKNVMSAKMVKSVDEIEIMGNASSKHSFHSG